MTARTIISANLVFAGFQYISMMIIEGFVNWVDKGIYVIFLVLDMLFMLFRLFSLDIFLAKVNPLFWRINMINGHQENQTYHIHFLIKSWVLSGT